jgi:glycerol-3-phosphate cytidylyltransferase-like family protein
MLSQQQLIESASSDAVRALITNIVIPPEVSIEELVVGLLDSYYNAQAKYNRGVASTQRLGFVADIKIVDSKILDAQAQSYELTKAFSVHAIVTTQPIGIKPALV